MDITTLRVAATFLSFFTFVGIVFWTLDRKKTAEFEEAAQLPFLDD
jgi:cytochrome c oxidase cbb3-type subunit IV